jgi:hypothetical protein
MHAEYISYAPSNNEKALNVSRREQLFSTSGGDELRRTEGHLSLLMEGCKSAQIGQRCLEDKDNGGEVSVPTY